MTGPNCLRLSNEHVTSLFEPVLARVKRLVEERLDRANAALADRGLRVAHILAAGGFSACPLVQTLVSKIEERCRPCVSEGTRCCLC